LEQAGPREEAAVRTVVAREAENPAVALSERRESKTEAINDRLIEVERKVRAADPRSGERIAVIGPRSPSLIVHQGDWRGLCKVGPIGQGIGFISRSNSAGN